MRSVIPLTLSLCIGCVPKKDYEALQAELAASQGTVAERDATVAERDQKILSLEDALAAAQAQSARLQGVIGEKEGALTSLRGEQAALLKDRTRLKSSVEEMQAALNELARRKAAADARVAEYKDLLARFKSLIDSGKLTVSIVNGRMVVQMATDILFESGKADLSAEGKVAVAEVASVLAAIPDRRYQIEGHTDDVPIQTSRFPSNWDLAAARSIGVTQAMVEAGLAPNRLSAASFSQYQPVAANDSKEGKASNSRIEIVVVPDLSQLPGFDELNALND